MHRKLNAWKSEELNIGIIGESGAGKSTFINTLRQLKPKDPGAAAVGVNETTLEPKSYDHPRNSNIKLWDLPGVGTPEFPKSEYLKKIQFERYDFFIIISSVRFLDNDLWFAVEIRKMNKLFIFVRTKIDFDVYNNQDDHGRTDDETLTTIRSDCTQNLIKAGVQDAPVFLICKNPRKYDFSELEAKLVSDLNKLKREAALLTMRSTSEPFIKEKTKQLQKRVWKVAIGSAFGGVVPVPGVSFAIDAAILNKELDLYKEVYGLDSNGLEELSESADLDVDSLVQEIRDNVWFNCTAVELLRDSKSLGKTVVKECLKFIPGLGSLVGGPASYAITSKLLHCCIMSMEKAALHLIEVAFFKTLSKKQ